MSDVLRLLDKPAPGSIPDGPLAFLASLDRPTAWRIPGRDRSRIRVVTTLLHGNEPSGFLGIHDWLRSGIEPAVDSVCVLANLEAARLHPVFTNRSVPKRRDLNRCFLGPWDDAEGKLARSILDLVEDCRPEALLDLHNNTGRNPPYAVGVEPTTQALELSTLFGDAFVWSHLRLGALLEAVEGIPAVTVEVGKSGEAVADRAAREGMGHFLETDQLFGGREPPGVRVLKMPMRACVLPERRLVMAQRPHASADLTMPDDLDRHNFEMIPAGSRIGWVRGEGSPLQLVDEDGNDRAPDYFERCGDELVARRSFMPIMVTVDEAIAVSDCVFYVVHEVSADEAMLAVDRKFGTARGS
jgi:hypothetical protein